MSKKRNYNMKKTISINAKKDCYNLLEQVIKQREKFDAKHNVSGNSWNPMNLIRSEHYPQNYFLDYCKNLDKLDLEVYEILQLCQVLLDENWNWRQAINDHSPKSESFCIECMNEIDKELEILRKVIKLMKS